MVLGKKLFGKSKKDGARAQETEAQAAGLAPATTDKIRRRNEQVGTVVKAKMQKTVVVAVERLVQHGLYRKTIKRTSTFMAHDEKGAKQGDVVRIVETRPLSKSKRWRVEEIVGKNAAAGVDDTAAAGR